MKRGEIYWIEPSVYRPVVGSVQKQRRPAVIVSNDLNNKYAKTLEVVFLSTAPKKDIPTHVIIRSTPRISTALCEQIQTVSDEQIGEYMGTCSAAEMAAIDACMLISLGIEQPAIEGSPLKLR